MKFIKNCRRPYLFLILFLVGCVVYRHAFSVPFLFDDWSQIVFNSKIHSLAWPWRFLFDTRRPVLYTSLAMNFYGGGLRTFGYHVFNVFVHIGAAMALFALIEKTCRLPRMKDAFRQDASLVALSAALLWLCHPLQTQAVTYIIQRAESLMGLFFILALYCCSQYMTSKKTGWLLGSVGVALLCGWTKEVALALPVVVVLYDRAFISDSFRAAFKDHVRMYLGLSLMWAAMGVLFFITPPEKVPTAGFAIKDLLWWEYAINQPRVVLHYLRLVIWPDPLVFDYQWPLVKDMGKLLPSIGIIVVAIAGFLFLYRRHPVVSFLTVSFFIILAPSSSFIPLKDLVNEYRMYIPLSCVMVLFTVWLKVFIDRVMSPPQRRIFFIFIMSFITLIYGVITDQRNSVYRNEESLWRDVLQKQPDNMRIWNDLGSYYYRVGRYQEAGESFFKALALSPKSAEVSANVAIALAAQKEFSAAIRYAQNAIKLSPDFAVGYYNLGIVYLQMGRDHEAIMNFEKTIQLGFVDSRVLENLGVALTHLGRHSEAAPAFKEAQRLGKK